MWVIAPALSAAAKTCLAAATAECVLCSSVAEPAHTNADITVLSAGAQTARCSSSSAPTGCSAPMVAPATSCLIRRKPPSACAPKVCGCEWLWVHLFHSCLGSGASLCSEHDSIRALNDTHDHGRGAKIQCISAGDACTRRGFCIRYTAEAGAIMGPC